MTVAEIKELTAEELKERIQNTKNELVRMKLEHTISPIEDGTVIKNTRRDIARMLTVLRQKEMLN